MGFSGVVENEIYDIGLRFISLELVQGQYFVYARLVLPALVIGQVDSGAEILIKGIDALLQA